MENLGKSADATEHAAYAVSDGILVRKTTVLHGRNLAHKAVIQDSLVDELIRNFHCWLRHPKPKTVEMSLRDVVNFEDIGIRVRRIAGTECPACSAVGGGISSRQGLGPHTLPAEALSEIGVDLCGPFYPAAPFTLPPPRATVDI
jgi:hypothetical protein